MIIFKSVDMVDCRSIITYQQFIRKCTNILRHYSVYSYYQATHRHQTTSVDEYNIIQYNYFIILPSCQGSKWTRPFNTIREVAIANRKGQRMRGDAWGLQWIRLYFLMYTCSSRLYRKHSFRGLKIDEYIIIFLTTHGLWQRWFGINK